MLLSRCAWHRRYNGYPLVAGVVSWAGWAVRFTDGICPSCMERFRAEHRAYIERRLPDAEPLRAPEAQRQVA